jgi:hypothetical protein
MLFMADDDDKRAELIAAIEAHIDATPNIPKFHFLRVLDLDSLSDDDLAVMKKGLDLIAAIDRLRAVAGKDIHFDIPLDQQFDAITLAALMRLKEDMNAVLDHARSLRRLAKQEQ